jgi:hypothetical protein
MTNDQFIEALRQIAADLEIMTFPGVALTAKQVMVLKGRLDQLVAQAEHEAGVDGAGAQLAPPVEGA